MATTHDVDSAAAARVDDDGADGFRLLSRPVLSWALYDFANTIFSLSVLTAYFNDWIVLERDGQEWYLAAMQFFVTVALILTMPMLGAVADRFGRRKGFLIAFTLASCTATALLSQVSSTVAALAVGAVAIFAYQSALSHYDPLLASVAPDARRGRVSGMGVGLGYVGALTGFIILGAIVGSGDSNQKAFLPTALLYLVFALPCFVFVREAHRPGAPTERPPVGTVMRDAQRQLRATVRGIGEHMDVVRFLAARFLYADALSVIITFMVIYMKRLGEFSESERTIILASSMIAAAVGAAIAGRLVERVGPRRVLLSVLSFVIVSMFIAGVTGSAALVWLLGPIIGIGLGSVWTSDRVFMMRISPPAARGEFFGVYNLVGKVSSFGGAGLWALTGIVVHQAFGWEPLAQNRAAIVVLACVMLGGALLVRTVDDAPRDWGADQLEHELEEL